VTGAGGFSWVSLFYRNPRPSPGPAGIFRIFHRIFCVQNKWGGVASSRHRTCGGRIRGSDLPTILREGRYRFYWYSHEPGESPHVHVDRDQRSAKFWLDSVGLARNIGFPVHELRRIRSIIEDNQATLLETWRGYFGT